MRWTPGVEVSRLTFSRRMEEWRVMPLVFKHGVQAWWNEGSCIGAGAEVYYQWERRLQRDRVRLPSTLFT